MSRYSAYCNIDPAEFVESHLEFELVIHTWYFTELSDVVQMYTVPPFGILEQGTSPAA